MASKRYLDEKRCTCTESWQDPHCPIARAFGKQHPPGTTWDEAQRLEDERQAAAADEVDDFDIF